MVGDTDSGCGSGGGGGGGNTPSSQDSVFTPGTERRLKTLMLGATCDVYLGGAFPVS